MTETLAPQQVFHWKYIRDDVTQGQHGKAKSKLKHKLHCWTMNSPKGRTRRNTHFTARWGFSVAVKGLSSHSKSHSLGFCDTHKLRLTWSCCRNLNLKVDLNNYTKCIHIHFCKNNWPHKIVKHTRCSCWPTWFICSVPKDKCRTLSRLSIPQK